MSLYVTSSASSSSSSTYSHVTSPAFLSLSSTSSLSPVHSSWSLSTFLHVSPTCFLLHLLHQSPSSGAPTPPPSPQLLPVTPLPIFTQLFSHSLPSLALPVLSPLLILPVLNHLTCSLLRKLSINLRFLSFFVPVFHLHLPLFLLLSLPLYLSPFSLYIFVPLSILIVPLHVLFIPSLLFFNITFLH